ncbi:hypothetical protein D3C75_1120650 [compost metagenome]
MPLKAFNRCAAFLGPLLGIHPPEYPAGAVYQERAFNFVLQLVLLNHTDQIQLFNLKFLFCTIFAVLAEQEPEETIK